MKTARRVLLVWLGIAVLAYCQGSTFDKIRYNGGSIQTRVDPKDWGNRLAVTPEEILLRLKDGQRLRIDPRRVHGLSYGQEAHRRVGTMIALGILVAPVALFGLFHKTRLHYVGIEFTSEDGKKAGVLLQAHKDNYRAVLMALRGVTGAPVAVAEDDRKYVPSGIETVTAASEKAGERAEEQKPEAPAVSPAPPQPTAPPQPIAVQPAPAEPEELTTVVLKSTPEGADILVDGKYVGATPSTIQLASGDHTISIEKSGFKSWQRTMTVSPGGIVTVDAALEQMQ